MGKNKPPKPPAPPPASPPPPPATDTNAQKNYLAALRAQVQNQIAGQQRATAGLSRAGQARNPYVGRKLRAGGDTSSYLQPYPDDPPPSPLPPPSPPPPVPPPPAPPPIKPPAPPPPPPKPKPPAPKPPAPPPPKKPPAPKPPKKKPPIKPRGGKNGGVGVPPKPPAYKPPLPPVGCFVAGTQISTPLGNGPIESIAVGDTVHSANGSHDRREAKVTEVFVHENRETEKLLEFNIGGRLLVVTREHPIFHPSCGEYHPAEQFESGDTVLVYDGYGHRRAKVIFTITEVPGQSTLFNIEVDPTNNYFANGVLVHNKIAP